jgi:hypothetical protein
MGHEIIKIDNGKTKPVQRPITELQVEQWCVDTLGDVWYKENSHHYVIFEIGEQNVIVDDGTMAKDYVIDKIIEPTITVEF